MIYVLPLLYLIFSFTVWKDIRIFCLLMFSLTLVDSFTEISSAIYFCYWVAFTDLMIIGFSLALTNLIRRYIIIFVSVVSMFLNLYEAFSFYQTIFYPYYNQIQFIITEIILIAAIYKGNKQCLPN